MLFALKKKIGKTAVEFLFDIAIGSEYLFTSVYDKLFIPRISGFRVRNSGLPLSRKKRFCCAGHRFMPFVSKETFPADARLVLSDGTSAEIKVTIISA
jgi:hypothetical protein